MTIGFTPKFDNRFKARFVQRFEQYQFEVGIPKDMESKQHKEAKSIYTKSGKRKKKKQAFTRIDGMTARKKRAINFEGDPTMKEILAFACSYVGVDLIKAPFQQTNSSAMRTLRRTMSKFFQAKNPMSKRRAVEEALLRVVRDPIKKKRYRPNSAEWARIKGFNRAAFDTGQLYQAIKAKVSKIVKKAS